MPAVNSTVNAFAPRTRKRSPSTVAVPPSACTRTTAAKYMPSPGASEYFTGSSEFGCPAPATCDGALPLNTSCLRARTRNAFLQRAAQSNFAIELSRNTCCRTIHEHLVWSRRKRNALEFHAAGRVRRPCACRVQIQLAPILLGFARMLKLDRNVCQRLIRLCKQTLHLLAQAVRFPVIALLEHRLPNRWKILACIPIIPVLWFARPERVLVDLQKFLRRCPVRTSAEHHRAEPPVTNGQRVRPSCSRLVVTKAPRPAHRCSARHGLRRQPCSRAQAQRWLPEVRVWSYPYRQRHNTRDSTRHFDAIVSVSATAAIEHFEIHPEDASAAAALMHTRTIKTHKECGRLWAIPKSTDEMPTFRSVCNSHSSGSWASTLKREKLAKDKSGRHPTGWPLFAAPSFFRLLPRRKGNRTLSSFVEPGQPRT